MKSCTSWLFVGLISVSAAKSICTEDSTSVLPKLETPIRILLQECPLSSTQWKLRNATGFMVYDPQLNTSEEFLQKELTISASGGTVSINKKRVSPKVYIIPRVGEISIDGNSYEGYLSVEHTERTSYLINHLGLEDYLASVLPYEAIPTWPDEVLKALCIACRTYALSVMIERRKKPGRFDVRCTVDDQVYQGKSTHNLRTIVHATRNQIITYNNKPICAMYNAVCGGIIPALVETSMLNQKPYLQRTYACTHCKNQKYYRWSFQYPFSELEHTLKKNLPNFGTLEELKIDSYDKAGVAQQIKIIASNKSYLLNAQNFRKLFPEIRSINCTFGTKDATLYAEGKGHGHHLGLCQWGAYAMATNGASYKSIITFYYPNTTLTSLDKLPTLV